MHAPTQMEQYGEEYTLLYKEITQERPPFPIDFPYKKLLNKIKKLRDHRV